MRKSIFILVLLVGAMMLMSCEKEPMITLQTDDNSGLKYINVVSGKVFDMNDRFATETTGASGFGQIFVTQSGGTIQVKLMQAMGLLPNHEYELQVVIDFATFYTSECISSGPRGNWKITNFTLPDNFDPGVYDVHTFVTHCHTTVDGLPGDGAFVSSIVSRDPLLACMPGTLVTVVE